MPVTIATAPATYHSDRWKAQTIADQCNTDDDEGWRYAVEQRGQWFVIVVYDDTGQKLGDL